MKKIAIVLAGCGAKDGAEIHESVLTMLAIDQHGAQYQCFAPDIPQHHVINHLTDEEMVGEPRSVLVESARICRGDIKPLGDYNPKDYDAIIFPGGFGAAKNLFTLALHGENFIVDPDVEYAVKETHSAGKPIGALCISPVMIARIIEGVTVTTGQDESTAEIVKSFGSYIKDTNHGEIVVDEKNKIISTPCYMLDARISDIANGADALVKSILELA